ncbi:Stealth CR1 domain-containing protein [Psychrobacter sp. S1-30-MNA-CIBAN-0213]|uniref:Stealth CR1 domain-containing protein n=1 Tax=unclassified Psychrobacter TaxID=196806 RepID=UPI003322CA31
MKQQGERKIDVVIAWVDGDSPTLKKKREHYKKTENVASGAVSATRFASNNEIYYNIASIIKYVPFCRHIYVVTDQQQPEFINEFFNEGLCPKDKIRIVDHKDIFLGYEQFLPTFNTRSIETMLWNIPELSDYFIYMNDDFFFNQPAKIGDFLDDDSIIIHGHWRKSSAIKAKLKYRKSLQKILGTKVQPKHTTAQMLSAQILNMNQFFEIHHYPHMVDKTTLKNYLLSNVQLLSEQIKYRFRDVAQFNPITLTNHLKIQQKEACLKPPTTINYLKNKSGVENFITNLQKDEVKYGCIQSLDLLDSDSYQRVTSAMMQKFSAHLPSLLLDTSE